MIYTKDNVQGLRIRRGGTAEYLIKAIWGNNVEIKHLYSGRVGPMHLSRALHYLTTGKWTVVGNGDAVDPRLKKTEEVYQIY